MTVVLLHGWGTHSAIWAEALAALPLRFAVRAVDLPGHGHGPHDPPSSFETAVEMVARELPGDAVLCGWSLGALFALRIASVHRERVRALVLVGATPCFVARHDWDCGMSAQDFEAFAREVRADPRAALRRFAALCALGGADSRGTLRLIEDAARRNVAEEGALSTALDWLRSTDLRGEAARIAQPALVVHGARDRVTPVAAGRWLAGAMPAARLAELEDAAHAPFLSHRRRFVEELESFLG